MKRPKSKLFTHWHYAVWRECKYLGGLGWEKMPRRTDIKHEIVDFII